MATRSTPEHYFAVGNTNTQPNQNVGYNLTIDPTTAFMVMGLIAVVGLIGIFVLLASGKK